MIVKINAYLDEKENVSTAINDACKALKDGDTLAFENKTYHIYNNGLFTKYYCISNNDKGDKPILFPLIGKKNITIDGNGASLIFHDGIIPFVIDRSENVCVKNFTVDYKKISYSQAEIVEADSQRTVLKFDGKEFCCKVVDNKICFCGNDEKSEVIREQALCLEFDKEKRAPSSCKPTYFFYTGEKKDHGFLRNMFRDVVFNEIGENLIEMRGDLRFSHTVGNMWVCTYGERDFPGVFVNMAKDVTLQNIKMHYACAMGVICQLSENIVLDNVVADIDENSGRMLSVEADATHFVNCRGKIDIKNCKFVNMLDDAVNIHGIYLKEPQKYTENSFIAEFGHYQQEGINIFKNGDKADIIDTETLKVVASVTVGKSEILDEKRILVVTKEKLGEIPEGCVVENVSTAPEIHITDTESGNNRPRGFLLSSSGKTVVENCKFYNMYAAINIGGEMLDWYESGATTDVLIKNNEFNNSAYAGGNAVFICPKIKNRETVGSFHDKITIENNRFTMHEKRIMQVSNVKNLLFKNNEFIFDEKLPSHSSSDENGIEVEYCENVSIDW